MYSPYIEMIINNYPAFAFILLMHFNEHTFYFYQSPCYCGLCLVPLQFCNIELSCCDTTEMNLIISATSKPQKSVPILLLNPPPSFVSFPSFFLSFSFSNSFSFSQTSLHVLHLTGFHRLGSWLTPTMGRKLWREDSDAIWQSCYS